MPTSSPTVQQRQDESLNGPLGAAFLLLMTKIYYEKSILSSSKDYPKDYGPDLINSHNPIFDIIIVGAGPAGVVLANRLSEVHHWSILLLEAGNLPSVSTEVPAFYFSLRGSSEDWNYYTQQERNACQGNKDKRCRISRGRLMGGTSSINNLHYVRALSEDFAKWPGESQHGWNRDQIEKNYRRHESYTGIDNGGEYGTKGELALDKLNEKSVYKDLIYEAANLMGYPKAKSGEYLGYRDILGTVDDGMRQNFAKAFLGPVKQRDNLAVARRAFVTKVLTQIPKDRRIQGVEVIIDGKKIEVKAKKEVILAAGAINTAQLLMLSGFGPKDHLRRLKIPVLVDLPVGRNFQDQVTTLMFVGIDKGRCEKDDRSTVIADDAYSYVMHRTGEFSHTNINDVVGFINTQQENVTMPNVMIYHYFFHRKDDSLEEFLIKCGYVEAIVKSISKYNKDECLILFMPTVIKPKSRGEILLQHRDPKKHPFIMGNYLSDPEDYHALLSGAKYVLAMIETEPFRQRDAHFLEVDMPNCRNFKYCNEPYLGCAVKSMAIPKSEIIGTATMGNIHDESRVTDEFLLLDGIRHLRIVDGSVIPEHIAGNLEATVAMMAENAADQIKKTWLKN